MANRVIVPAEYFPDFRRGRPVFRGQIFIGQPNTDPEIPANQKQVSVTDTGINADPLEVAQPIETGAGGTPVYNGAPVSILVEGNYSLKVLDNQGRQVYYFADVLGSQPITSEDIGNYTDYAFSTLSGLISRTTSGGQIIASINNGQVAYLSQSGRAGHFVFDSSDLSVQVAADPNQGIYVATNLDLTGASGAWVRNHGGSVSPDYYGAVGDWNGTTGTDDASAMSSAFGSGFPVFLRGDARYLIATAIPVENSSLIIEGNGAEIIQMGDFAPITINLEFTNQQAVTTLAVESIDLSGGSTIPTPVAVVTVASTTGYSVGDYVKIYSDNIIPATDPANEERLGEFAKVSSIDAGENKIFFYSVLRETYTTNIRVARMSSQHRISIRDINFDIDDSDNPSWNEPMIEISGALEASLENLYCNRSRNDVYRFISCFGLSTTNLSAGDMRTDLANNAFGYVAVDYSCEGSTHDQLKGYNARHVFTTGTLATNTSDTRTARYGSTRDFVISDGYGFACQNSAFDTHPDARNGLFIGCIAVSPYNGPIGTQLNYQMRGIGSEIKNCQSVGGRGYRIAGEFDSLGSARDNKIIDCRHAFIRTFNQTREAVQITGASSTNRITGALVSNLVVDKIAGSWTQMVIQDAEVEVINPQIRDVSTGSGLGTFLSANGDSDVVIRDLFVDYRSSTDPFIRMFEIFNIASKVRLYGARIFGDVEHIVDFNSLDGGEFRCENVNFETQAPENSTGVTNAGATSTASIDYFVQDSTVSTRADLSIDYNSGGDKEVDLQYRGAKQLFLEVTAAQITTDITTISAGAFIGQMISIRCGATSANNIDIETGTGNISIGTDFTIAIGRSFNLVWDNTNWVAA